MGIMIEISYDASIHDNVIAEQRQRGGKPRTTDPVCSTGCGEPASPIAASGGVGGGLVEIFNNTITSGSPCGTVEQRS